MTRTPPSQIAVDVLRLTLTPGLGPTLIPRLIETFGSPADAARASAADLQRVKGIGPAKAASIAKALREADAAVDAELTLAESLGVRLIAIGEVAYPPLLAQIPAAPPLIYVRGEIDHAGADAYPVAIVGSRDCTHYGREQAARFGRTLAGAGLTVVSGGARGIDTAAHRGALQDEAGGRTIAVMGCGLAQCYPPDNRELYDQIARGRGAVVSELPLNTAPATETFPARNRIISGLSLGVVVIEAGRGSGSLITARTAAEDQGREVMAVPGRIDSAASEGVNELIKMGGAALITGPGDVLEILKTPARHHFHGTHASRYADPGQPPATPPRRDDAELFPAASGNAVHDRILEALREPLTADQLAELTGLAIHVLRGELTVLEIHRRVTRSGSLFRRAGGEKR